MYLRKLILVFTIASILFSCSNSAKKEPANTESTAVDTVRTVQELPEQHDSIAVIPEVEKGTDVNVSKQDEPKTFELVNSQVKDYAIKKPLKSIRSDGTVPGANDYKAIAHSETHVQGIKHAIPSSPTAAALPPQHTTEARNDEVTSLDTASMITEPASEQVVTTKSESSVPKKKSARLAYNYSSEMKRNVSEDINVYVSIVNSGSFVKDTLMKIVAQQKNPGARKANTDSIVTANILLYKRIKVELIDPDAAFKIDSVYGNGWQDVDSIGDNRWRWSVKPLTDQPNAKLVIKVVAKTPAGAIEDIDDRTFFIKVEMTGPFQMFRTWWIYLQDHPELFLTVIIIPLIAFFGKRYFDRKKEQKP